MMYFSLAQRKVPKGTLSGNSLAISRATLDTSAVLQVSRSSFTTASRPAPCSCAQIDPGNSHDWPSASLAKTFFSARTGTRLLVVS